MMADSSDITVHTEERGDTMILRPVGEIDLGRTPALRVVLMDAMKGRPSRLILDLADVTYMDSSGVATFIEAMGISRKNKTVLVLCNLQDRVQSIFEIARLEMVFTIVTDTEAALTA